MKNRFFFAACMLVLAYSCSTDGKSAKPSIGQDQMANLLSEIALAEGYAETYLLRDTTLDRDSIIRTQVDLVFKIRKVDQTQFRSSYKYYRQHPQIFKVLLDTANARASKNRDEIHRVRNIRPS